MKKRFTEQQIVAILKEGEAGVGVTVKCGVQQAGIRRLSCC